MRLEVTLAAAIAVLPWSLQLRAQDTASLAVSKANRTVAITATERVTHLAEIGVVHVGFIIYGPSRDAAYTAGATTSNAIMKALLAAGARKDTIQSESQELTETQFFNPPLPSAEERQAKAFNLRQSWTVRVAADDSARLLDIAVRAGANQSGQIDWQLADPNAAQAEAAAKAIQRAQAQAKAMANGLSVHLGDLLYASNQVEGGIVRPAPMNINRMTDMAPPAPPPPPLAINAREIETAATVYAVFALE